MEQEKLIFIQQNAPCYLYDNQQIIEQCRILQSVMPEEIFLYSIKTNPFAPVVQSIAQQGFGADAASANEVLRAEQAGIPPELIFYSAPGKTEQDIEKAWGKCTIIADSFYELELLERYAANKNAHISIGVRVNPGFSIDSKEAVPSKFGIDETQLTASALSFPHLKISGIHIHLRSQILDTDLLCAYYRNCYTLAERINELPCVDISFINFGSGIGTVYDETSEKPLVLEKLGQTMRELHQRNSQCMNAKFILETGRFVVCSAGTYYTKIVDRKVSCGKIFLVVQNAMNGFMRPAIAELLRQNLGDFPVNGQEPLYTSKTQSAFHILEKDADFEKVEVVGNLCTSLDVMATDVILPHAEVGDILEVTNAGSYGCTLTPQLFSSQEPVIEFLWNR